MRRSVVTLVSAGAFVAVVLAALWTVHPAPPPGPFLDSSTPNIQPGFDALAVVPVDWLGSAVLPPPDARSVWQKLLDWVLRRHPASAGIATAVAPPGARGGVALWLRQTWTPAAGAPLTAAKAWAILSTGQSAPASVYPVRSAQGDLLCISAPSAWPASARYVDIGVSDAAGHGGRWRLCGLPKTRHAIPPTTPTNATLEAAGIRLAGSASWESNPPAVGLNQGDVVRYGVRALNKAPGPYRWEMMTRDPIAEWEPDCRRSGSSTMTADMGQGWGPDFLPLAYRGAQARLQLTGDLREYDAVDETVTFRDVPVVWRGNDGSVSLRSPRTATTPSGIKVVLSAQHGNTYMGAGVAYRISVPAHVPRANLRGSRLAAPGGPDCTVSVMTGDGVEGISQSNADPPGTFDCLRTARRGIRSLPTLSVRVRHRVDIRSLPFSLVVPIEDPARVRR